MDSIEIKRIAFAENLSFAFKKGDTIEGLKGRSVNDTFSNQPSKREFLATMSDQDFADLLCSINGLVQGKNKDSWGFYDKTVHLTGHIETIVPPRPQDKHELIKNITDSARKMNQEGRSLSDIGLMISVAVNSIHPWEDGNGRTTRVLYSLIAEEKEKRNGANISHLLSEDGRDSLQTDTSSISVQIKKIMITESNPDFDNLFNDIPTSQNV